MSSLFTTGAMPLLLAVSQVNFFAALKTRGTVFGWLYPNSFSGKGMFPELLQDWNRIRKVKMAVMLKKLLVSVSISTVGKNVLCSFSPALLR